MKQCPALDGRTGMRCEKQIEDDVGFCGGHVGSQKKVKSRGLSWNTGSRSKMVSNLRVGHRVRACAYEDEEVVRHPVTGYPLEWAMVVVAIVRSSGSTRWNKAGARFVVCVKERDANHAHSFDADGYTDDVYRFHLIERMKPRKRAQIETVDR